MALKNMEHHSRVCETNKNDVPQMASSAQLSISAPLYSFRSVSLMMSRAEEEHECEAGVVRWSMLFPDLNFLFPLWF